MVLGEGYTSLYSPTMSETAFPHTPHVSLGLPSKRCQMGFNAQEVYWEEYRGKIKVEEAGLDIESLQILV